MGDKFTFGIRNGQQRRPLATGNLKRIAYAKKRGIEWTLTEEEYAAAANGVCFYCRCHITTGGVGLDRMDNARGYVPGNVVACCYRCNTEKGATITYDEYVMLWAYRRNKARALSPKVNPHSRGLRAQRQYNAWSDRQIVEKARESAPSIREIPDTGWRELINTRADKRECGLDVEAPWPDLPADDQQFLAWRQSLGITQRQAARLLEIRGVKRCGYRTVQRLEVTGALWQDRHTAYLST